MQTCRSCKGQIRWLTLNGNRHPIDHGRLAWTEVPAPEKFYGLVAVPDDPLREAFVVSQYTTLAELRDCELRRSHFASCPDSAAWRKKQTAAKA